MSELKPCPFCGWEFAEHAWNEFGEEYRVCDQCGASSGTVDSKWNWQSRPIEDALNARIAKLKAVIDQLIEVGEKMFTAVIAAADPYDEGMREWDKIVNGRKEG